MPWNESVYCWLFKEETEELLLNPGSYNFPFEQLIGEVITLDPENAEIIKRLQTGLHRNKHVINLLLNLELIDCIGIKPKMRKVDKNGQTTEVLEDPTYKNKPIKDYVRKIFKKHYELEKNNLKKQAFFPSHIVPDEPSWKTLKAAVDKMKLQLIDLKKNYLDVILSYTYDEKFSVFSDIRIFLKSNKLDEETPPTITELQSQKYKEYGLVKKISKGPGMSVVRKEYTPWLLNQRAEEKTEKTYSYKEIEEEYSLKVPLSDLKEAVMSLGINVSSDEYRFSESDRRKINEFIEGKYLDEYSYP